MKANSPQLSRRTTSSRPCQLRRSSTWEARAEGSSLRLYLAEEGKVAAARLSHLLLVTGAVEGRDRPGTKGKQRVKHRWERLAYSHLLNESAAQGHISTTEDVGHVPWYFQIVLAIHTWDLKGNGAYVRHVTTPLSSFLHGQRKAHPNK